MTARLRQFVKDKKFELRNFSTYGLENVLVVPRCKNDQVQSIASLLFQLVYYFGFVLAIYTCIMYTSCLYI